MTKLLLSRAEAAEALGVSEDFFDEHVRPEIRPVYKGRRVLIPVRELERWVERNAVGVLRICARGWLNT
jgi:excisionase family DNA binding protein